METMKMLSDDSGDVDNDWHYESLKEENSEGLPKVVPVEV